MGSNPGYLLKNFLLYQTWKKEIYDFWKFSEANKKNDDGLNRKNHASLFWQFFRWQRKYLFKICQSDTSNKVLTPISPNFYTLQTWNDNLNEDNKTKVEIFL